LWLGLRCDALFEIAGNTAKTGNKAYQVHCNTGTADVSIAADSLVSAAGAPAGYSNIIHYTAQLAVDVVGGSFTPITVDSEAATSTTTESATTLARVVPGSDNVTISVFALNTLNAAELLVAATDYAGEIRVTIAPAT
jgi:hypothetical protein